MDKARKIKTFTDLLVWQEGHVLILFVYRVTKIFPKYEQFSLTSQMQRAAISITSNIAEGFGRKSYREKIQFYYLAQGSLIELKNQILIAKDLQYIQDKTLEELIEQTNQVHKLLQGLITKSKTYIPIPKSSFLNRNS